MAKLSYPAFAFYPSLGNEVVAGTISFDSENLFFFAESGKITIPLGRLDLRLDKASDRIYLTDSQEREGNIFVEDFEILEHRVFTHNLRLRDKVDRITGAKNAWIKLALPTAIFFAVFLLVTLCVFWAGGITLRFLVNKVPTKYESDLGDEIVAKLKARRLLAKNPEAIAFLENTGKRLLPKEAKSKFKFEFHVVEVSEPNAFAVPGGKIFVTEGALQLLSEEELTGVLAHEITHVVERHSLRQIISSIGTYAALRLLVKGDTAFQTAVGDASELLFTSGFSQAMENEADDGAWKYLVAAKIDPRCLPNSLRKLEAEKSKADRASPQIFSTHPLTSERLKRFDKKWSELKSKTNFVSFPETFPKKPAQ